MKSVACHPATGRASWSYLSSPWAGLALGVVVALAVGASKSLRINFTSSLPRGFYRIVAGPPSRGAIVVACLPQAVGQLARERGYVWRGDCPGGAAPIGKTVVGVPGDTIITTAAGIIVNGRPLRDTRVLERDSRRRPLRHFPFALYVLSPRQLWLASSYNSHSFDSRYFGPVDVSLVRSRIEKLWTLP